MTQTETKQSMAFVSGIAIAGVAGVGSALRFSSSAHGAHLISIRMLGALIATALFGVVGNLCMFAALRHAPTALVSQFHYSQLPVGALVGYLLWRERPTAPMTVGAMLIIAAGIYIAKTSTAPAEFAMPPEGTISPG